MNQDEVNEIGLAIESLKLALRISNAIDKDSICLEPLREGLILDNINGVRIPIEKDLSKENIYQDALNLQVSALGTCMMVLDRILGLVIRKNPTSDINIDKIRSIIYQIRNAYAHNPLKPIWFSKKSYLRIYRVNIGNKIIELDLASMNNVEFDIEHIGGFNNLFKLIEVCKNYISKTPKII